MRLPALMPGPTASFGLPLLPLNEDQALRQEEAAFRKMVWTLRAQCFLHFF